MSDLAGTGWRYWLECIDNLYSIISQAPSCKRHGRASIQHGQDMRLLLDSSAVLCDPARSKEALKTVEHLVAKGHIALYVPEVVVREVQANLTSKAQVEFDKLQAAASALRRRLPASLLADEWRALERDIKHATEHIIQALEQDFGVWLSNVAASIDPIAEGDGGAVMDGYFLGKPPFKESRHRDDIPDAFILESIRRLSTSATLHVVIRDERLAQAAADLSRVTVHRTLDSFIVSPGVQAILRQVAGTENLATLARLVSSEPDLLDGKLSDDDYVDLLAGESICSPLIPGDNNEATISMVGAVDDLTFDWGRAEYYGDDKVVVPFSFVTEVYADSYIFKSDWYAMTDEESEAISVTDWNDHYYLAQAPYQVVVVGLAAISLHLDLSERVFSTDEVAAALNDCTIAVDSVESIKMLHDEG